MIKEGIVEIFDDAGNPYEFEHYRCPSCKNILSQRMKGAKTSIFTPRYCPDCGQSIDWDKAITNKERGG